MANTNAPFGFRYASSLSGEDEVIRQYIHAAADGTLLGKGDPVDTTGAADTIARGVSGSPIVGIGLTYVAASTLANIDVLFLTQRSVLYAQEDSDGGSIAAASEALNINYIVAAASATTGLSQVMLDSSSAAASATDDLVLFAPHPSDTVASSYCRWFVIPNNLRLANQLVGH